METENFDPLSSQLCNKLLRVELAAAEVYCLAETLLGDVEGAPDYSELRAGHDEQVTSLKLQLERNGDELVAGELSWDRPRSAVLSAATVYGAESPVEHLIAQEEEIVSTYLSALEEVKSESPAAKFLTEQLDKAERLKSCLNPFLRSDESYEEQQLGQSVVDERGDAVA